MSRSYKKYPVVRQERINKRRYNRKFRRTWLDYATRGSQYKRVVASDDYDWHYQWTLQDAISGKSDPGWWRDYWYRCCYRK